MPGQKVGTRSTINDHLGLDSHRRFLHSAQCNRSKCQLKPVQISFTSSSTAIFEMSFRVLHKETISRSGSCIYRPPYHLQYHHQTLTHRMAPEIRSLVSVLLTSPSHRHAHRITDGPRLLAARCLDAHLATSAKCMQRLAPLIT